MTWLKQTVAGNDRQLKRGLEAVNSRFWTEGKLKGKQFRFDRWKAAEEEKQRRRKAEHARKRFRQLVGMMSSSKSSYAWVGLSASRGGSG